MNPLKPLNYLEAAARWFGRDSNDLDAAARKALARAERRQTLTEDPNRKLDEQATLGERMADRVAQFGGSWTFISIFGLFLLGWAASANLADNVNPVTSMKTMPIPLTDKKTFPRGAVFICDVSPRTHVNSS